MNKRNRIVIPQGKLADAAADLRASIANRLRNNKEIEVGNDGDVTGKTKGTKLTVQPGKLADAASDLRAMIANRLRNNKEIEVGNDGDVTGKTKGTKLTVQPGKLAYGQWYEEYPQLLEDEKASMNHFFPHFTLHKNKDGRLFWHGTLRPGILKDGWAWEVGALYNNDHPTPVMGGSVRVVLLNPTMQDVENSVGQLHHVLRDPIDGPYLCTTRAEDMSGMNSNYVTTAAQTLSWAVKWLTALELVLSGELSLAEFNQSNGI